MPQKVLPREITSYDLLKTFALVTMICDHIGFFFLPGHMWWRVIGRLCVPIWFYLIGYAQSRDTGPKIWAGTAILLASNFITGMSILPINILGTMIFLRLVIDPVMKAALRSASSLWGVTTMFVLLIPPSEIAFEYGTMAVPMAIFGYLVRHRGHLKEPRKILIQYFAFSYLFFVLYQVYMFHFHGLEVPVLCVGSLAVMAVLFLFRPMTFPRLTAALPRPVTALLQFTGRHTLLIYVVHLVLFKVMCLWLQPHRFIFMNWKWFSPTGT